MRFVRHLSSPAPAATCRCGLGAVLTVGLALASGPAAARLVQADLARVA
ncbi:electron transporter, partial [Methylobacterium radiotolerans]